MSFITKELGIRAHLITGILITTVAGIVSIGIIAVSILQDDVLSHKRKEAETVVRIVKKLVDDKQGELDGVVLEKYLRTIVGFADIRELRVRSKAAMFTLEKKLDKVPERAVDARILEARDEMRIRLVGGAWLNEDSELYVTLGELPGSSTVFISFFMPLRELAVNMAYMMGFIVIYAILVSLIITILGAYFLSRKIVTPIKKLDAVAGKIASGDLDKRADVLVNNELGSLAKSFNTMAERLKGEIDGLARVNRELVDTQEKLLMTSKLAAVGRLAAGLAHEIGNPLGAMQGYVDLLSRGDSLSDPEREDITARLSKEISRINNIIEEFLDLARPSTDAPHPIDVNSVLRETVNTLAHHGAFKNVEIEVELKDDVPAVIMDEGKFRQVLMNLLLNAAEAVEDNGIVSVVSSTVEVGVDGKPVVTKRATDVVADVNVPDRRVREFVTISVRDTGKGVKKEDIQKIFDPFFTTKEPGEGTGLGLFISQSIIENFGGTLNVSSPAIGGAEFTVSLPAKES
ncbi:MAG: HAMP domain-containing protein [Deltaproteobacteria bacterium]|nr:HAMP domain-containing protein [Deltaproteobacteria bacterium]